MHGKFSLSSPPSLPHFHGPGWGGPWNSSNYSLAWNLLNRPASHCPLHVPPTCWEIQRWPQSTCFGALGIEGFVVALRLWKTRVIFCGHNPRVPSQCNYKSITLLPTLVPLPFGQVKSLPWLLSPLCQTFIQAIYLMSHESSQLNVIWWWWWRQGGWTYLFNSEQQKACHWFPRPPQPWATFCFAKCDWRVDDPHKETFLRHSPGGPLNMQPSAHHSLAWRCPQHTRPGEATGSPRGRHWGSIGREVFLCIEKYEELLPNFPYDTHLKKGKESAFLCQVKHFQTQYGHLWENWRGWLNSLQDTS